MTHFPIPNWWCAAPSCMNRGDWRVEISSTTFITCCAMHKDIYKRMLPGVIKKTPGNFRLPKGWDALTRGNRMYGGSRVAPPWEKG